jgi:hypothetical protein
VTALSEFASEVCLELWVSLASLLRSYAAAHGLNGKRQATVELGEDKILLRCGDDWLELERAGAHVTWRREDGSAGTLEFTEDGKLRGGAGPDKEVEMDMAAEAWAQELLR